FGQAILQAPTQAFYIADTHAVEAVATEVSDLPRTVRAVAVLPLYSRRHGSWQGIIVAHWPGVHPPAADERLLHTLLIHATAEAIASEQARARNETLLREAREALQDSQRQSNLLSALFEHLPVGVSLMRGDTGAVEFVNPAGLAALGQELPSEGIEVTGAQIYVAGESEPLTPERFPVNIALRTGQRVRTELEMVSPSGTRRIFDATAVPIKAGEDGVVRALMLFHDLTYVRQAERERFAAQEQLLRMQSAALLERSTPLIPVREDVLVMPLIGSIDPERGRQILETLTHLGGRTHVRTVILDLTGVRSVDTASASALINAAMAVRLRGVRPLLTGIQPAVAATLVSLAVDFGSLEVFASLQDAVAQATRR
ncbi:MAG TPA: STAS domain-containing protein, partial [Nannocystis sp.]